MRVDYLGLEAFVAIAEHGSFQRAAEALNLSQAALSHRLRKIEDDLGAALLIRSSREVSLSPSGHALLPDARRLLKALFETYEAARMGARDNSRRFTFACLPTLANAFLPKVLKALHAERPELSFDLLDIPVSRIVDAVRSGRAEFGLSILSAELSDLRLRPLAEEDYRLFLRHDDPLAAQAEVTLEHLESRAMVRISSQSKNRQLLDTAFGEMRDRLRWQYEVESATVAMRLVTEGMALTILPRSAISMAPASLVEIPIAGLRLQRSIGVVSRRGQPLSSGAAELLARIETAMQEDGFETQAALSAAPATRPRG
ncbi:LysR family transcriptional regulator [Poseidonocella sedimentorum]|uniref:DNA-binding transcriptional regulator, LysR family n=1 Tax=Poseidonocella sedimentorum TaxID=871652 RepID=A0A1I6EDB5_9RHOB|nr:LysR family transcriptional regulator [Poseidonocella sedimentorum]SFR15492.1 DNA-binding transcriptional regulator, LysR family [Poseidonocella sedimentorum]